TRARVARIAQPLAASAITSLNRSGCGMGSSSEQPSAHAARRSRATAPHMQLAAPTMRRFLSLMLLAACGTAPELSTTSRPSFEEFEASVYREPWDGGLYIVNGDTPVPGKKALRELWE